jgi:hypothetical protein
MEKKHAFKSPLGRNMRWHSFLPEIQNWEKPGKLKGVDPFPADPGLGCAPLGDKGKETIQIAA